MNIEGNTSDNQGTNVIRSKAATDARRKGQIAIVISSIEVLPILQATNKVGPTGGVAKPIAKLTHMMMPKCTG